MKDLQTGQDKVKKICDLLKKETLEPAKQKAKEIIENAKIEAERIKAEGEREGQKIFEATKKKLELEKKTFQSSLDVACRQILDDLKRKIETEFFDENLSEAIREVSSREEVVKKLVETVINAIEKEGISKNISVYISKNLDPQVIGKSLTKKSLERLREKELVLGDFEGGLVVKLHDEKITIDISSEAIKEMVAKFIRKDFRDIVFR